MSHKDHLNRVTNKHRFDHIRRIVLIFPTKTLSRHEFPGLAIRPKWHVENRNVQKDDVALMQDSNVACGECKCKE